MMPGNSDERYFYLGGFISLSIFMTTVLFFIMVVLHKNQVVTFAMEKDNYISVSLDMDMSAMMKNKVLPEPKPVEEPVKKPEPEPEEIETTPDPVETDVSTLFDDVWTQSAETSHKKEPTKEDSKRLAAIEKRLKTKQTQKSSKASEAVEKLDLVKPSIEVVDKNGKGKSTGPEVNEYLAKIHAQVKSRFFPPASTEGESAKVLVQLDAYGKMTGYKILVSSRSNLFNEEVERLEQRLKREIFPKNPDGESISLEIILTVEE